jgi:tRNA (cytidine32/uridine32-2'-O)-methyltransferase
MLDRQASCYIILVEPSHPGNIGATARAMKTMGFRQLILVNPKQFPHPEATALASGATDVLDAARVVPDLATAVASAQNVVGVSARVRDVPLPCVTPREFADNISDAADIFTAIVFGNEQSGLSNEDLARCHQQIRIPTAADYGSLNLAQAVQIVCYELAQIHPLPAFGHNRTHAGEGSGSCMPKRGSDDFPLPQVDHDNDFPLPLAGEDGAKHQERVSGKRVRAASPASQQDFDGMFTHWCEVLEAAHYLHPQQRQKMLLRMRQLWLRTQPTTTEITMLRGAFRNILRHIQ